MVSLPVPDRGFRSIQKPGQKPGRAFGKGVAVAAALVALLFIFRPPPVQGLGGTGLKTYCFDRAGNIVPCDEGGFGTTEAPNQNEIAARCGSREYTNCERACDCATGLCSRTGTDTHGDNDPSNDTTYTAQWNQETGETTCQSVNGQQVTKVESTDPCQVQQNSECGGEPGGGVEREAQFTLSVLPVTRILIREPGTQASTTFSVFADFASGFFGPVGSFRVSSGLPGGASGTFAPASVTASGGSTTLTLDIGASVANGTYTFTVAGDGGGATQTVQASLLLTSGTFQLAANPEMITVVRPGVFSCLFSWSCWTDTTTVKVEPTGLLGRLHHRGSGERF